jgi:hypothetical protein
MQIFSFCMAVLIVELLFAFPNIHGAPEEIRTPDPQIIAGWSSGSLQCIFRAEISRNLLCQYLASLRSCWCRYYRRMPSES